MHAYPYGHMHTYYTPNERSAIILFANLVQSGTQQVVKRGIRMALALPL